MTRTEEETLRALIREFGYIALELADFRKEIAALKTAVDALVAARNEPEVVLCDWIDFRTGKRCDKPRGHDDYYNHGCVRPVTTTEVEGQLKEVQT